MMNFQKLLKFAKNKWTRVTAIWIAHLFLFFLMKDIYIWKKIWILFKFLTEAFLYFALGTDMRLLSWQIRKETKLNFEGGLWKTLHEWVNHVNFKEIG